jgi:hypothetical protein
MFIFSKNQLFVSLILCMYGFFVEGDLVSISLILALICIIFLSLFLKFCVIYSHVGTLFGSFFPPTPFPTLLPLPSKQSLFHPYL